MQQANIGLSGKTVVAGLTWTVITKSGPGRKKDIRKACVDTGLTQAVIVVGTEEAAIGLCAKKVEFPSGAAMVAAANMVALKARAFGDTASEMNWILVERVKSGDKAGMYWMCAVNNGIPVPGSDIIEDLTVISARLADLIDILENVEIFSIEPEILEYVAEAGRGQEMGFAQLTEKVAGSKAMRPQKMGAIPDWAYVLIIGLAVLVGGGLGISWYVEEQAQEAKRRQAEAIKVQAAKLNQENVLRRTREYQQADAAARNAELARVATALSKSPADVLRGWAAAVNALPLNHGGWNMEGVTCGLSSCTVTLVRDETVGTAASLKAIVPAIQFSDAGAASYTVAVQPSRERSVSLGKLPTWPVFALTVGTALQLMKMSGVVEASLGPRKDLTYRPPALPAATGAAGTVAAAQGALNNAVGNPPAGAELPQPPRPIGYLTGPIQIKGSSLWQLDHVGEYIDSMEFAVDGFRVEFAKSLASDAAWSITGSYYLQAGGAGASGPGAAPTQPSGMIPQGSGPMPPMGQPLPAAPAQPRK